MSSIKTTEGKLIFNYIFFQTISDLSMNQQMARMSQQQQQQQQHQQQLQLQQQGMERSEMLQQQQHMSINQVQQNFANNQYQVMISFLS